jgi:AraC-like DNA-binding protein
MTFSLFDLLLIVIFSQGLFLLIVIQLMPNKNKEANKSLMLLLAIASIMLLGRVLLDHIQNPYFFRFGAVVDTMIYLFGPFLYIYIRRLTFREQKTFRLNWLHYIPAISYFGYFVWSLTVSNKVMRAFHQSGNANILYFFVILIGMISMVVYIIKSYLLFRVFKRNQASELSYNQHISKYILSLLIALSCFVILWVFSFVTIAFFKVYFRYINYDAMWISSSLLMYFVGFYSLTQPHIFRMPIKSIPTSEKNKERLKVAEVENLQKLIETAMGKEQLYLASDLSLSALAEKLKTTSNNLSWVLNKVYQKNFYEFVNEYRVRDFINRIKHDEHKQLTIFSIALEVGFNSKSTFNKAFKTITQETPSAYIKKIENS